MKNLSLAELQEIINESAKINKAYLEIAHTMPYEVRVEYYNNNVASHISSAERAIDIITDSPDLDPTKLTGFAKMWYTCRLADIDSMS